MLSITKNIAFSSLLCASLCACVTSTHTSNNAGNEKNATTEPPQAPPGKPLATSSNTTLVVTQQMAEAMAIDALRQHLDDDKTPVRVLSRSAVDWPDASIGCPQPGFHYPQVIIPGYLISLDSGAKTYKVHVAKKRALVCTKNTVGFSKKPPKPMKTKTLLAQHMTNLAKADLAVKIIAVQKDIRVVSFQPVTWPNHNLGCDDLNTQPKGKDVAGYRIIFAHKGRTYTYHTDNTNRVRACPKITSF